MLFKSNRELLCRLILTKSVPILECHRENLFRGFMSRHSPNKTDVLIDPFISSPQTVGLTEVLLIFYWGRGSKCRNAGSGDFLEANASSSAEKSQCITHPVYTMQISSVVVVRTPRDRGERCTEHTCC